MPKFGKIFSSQAQKLEPVQEAYLGQKSVLKSTFLFKKKGGNVISKHSIHFTRPHLTLWAAYLFPNPKLGNPPPHTCLNVFQVKNATLHLLKSFNLISLCFLSSLCSVWVCLAVEFKMLDVDIGMSIYYKTEHV